MSRQEAEGLIPDNGCAIISISDSPKYPAKISNNFLHIKRMYFLDGIYEEKSIIQFGANFTIAFHNFFRKPHAEEIIHFLRSMDIASITNLYVHCKAGESRSAAVAKYISETFKVPAYKLQFGVLHQDQYFPKANTLVYQLLCNPTYFDNIIDCYKPGTGNIQQRDSSNHSSGILWKIANFFGLRK